MKDEVYQKLKKARKAESMKLADNPYLKDELTKPDGTKVPFKLRHYQVQMIYHMLLTKKFVVGDDTGLGKCCSKDTLIQTDRGLIPICEMHKWSDMTSDTFEPIDQDWNVLVGGEALPVKNFYYGGVKPTIKVKTRYGFEVEGSRVHPLRVWRGCEHQWVETRDLREGDYLCVERREMDFPTEEPTLETDVTARSTSETYPVPVRMNSDFARFLGYYIGEGSLTSLSQVRISQCPEKNPEIHEDILHLISSHFSTHPKHIDQSDLYVNSTYIRQYLYQNGLDYVTSHDRSVPDCILRSTKESNRQFLRGIFEAEGHVLSTGGIEFSTASEELGRQLQIMLLRFGIVTNRSTKIVKGFEHNDYWRLTIFGRDARIFRDKIGFVSKRKQEALENVLDKPINANHDVVPEAKPLIEDLRALLKVKLTKTGSNSNRKGSGFKQYGVSFVNTLNHIRNAGRNPTYDFIEKLLSISKENGLENSAPYRKLKALTETHYFYDPVVSLEEGVEEVFDIEIDDPRHCFIGNGLINHNTAESIAAMCYMWVKEPHLKPLIITNTSAMRQWAGEVDKFTNGVSWRLVEGGPEDREEIYEDYFNEWDDEHPEFLIVNYPRLRRDHRYFLELMEDQHLVVIADEATAFKNPSSKTHHVMRKICDKAERSYGLTATLIKNDLMEGYGIYKVLAPKLFASKSKFMRRYCVTRMQKIKGSRRKIPIVVGHSKDHIKKFKEKIDPYYLGRPKHAVADELPLLNTKEIFTGLTATQWSYYKDALNGFLTINETSENEEEEEKEVTHLTQLIYTQQIVNSPALIGNDGSSSKQDRLMDMLENELDKEKVIVFTRFRGMVDELEIAVKEKFGYKSAIQQDGKEWEINEVPDKTYARITGAEDDAQRDAGKRAFTDTENCDLIFLTMAGAEAINLQQARVMVFFDMPWSAGDYLQLIGRMIRIGSPHQSVYALHMVSEGPLGEDTIDSHVLKTLDKKMKLIESVIGERVVKGEDPSEEEIIELTSDSKEIFKQLKEQAHSLKD